MESFEPGDYILPTLANDVLVALPSLAIPCNGVHALLLDALDRRHGDLLRHECTG